MFSLYRKTWKTNWNERYLWKKSKVYSNKKPPLLTQVFIWYQEEWKEENKIVGKTYFEIGNFLIKIIFFKKINKEIEDFKNFETNFKIHLVYTTNIICLKVKTLVNKKKIVD